MDNTSLRSIFSAAIDGIADLQIMPEKHRDFLIGELVTAADDYNLPDECSALLKRSAGFLNNPDSLSDADVTMLRADLDVAFNSTQIECKVGRYRAIFCSMFVGSKRSVTAGHMVAWDITDYIDASNVLGKSFDMQTVAEVKNFHSAPTWVKDWKGAFSLVIVDAKEDPNFEVIFQTQAIFKQPRN